MTECIAEIRFVVTDEDIDDIMASALDGGITYWCSEARVVGDYLGEYASEQISRGGTLILVDAEEDEEYELDKHSFISGLCEYIEHHFTGNEFEKGQHKVARIDPGNIDAVAADCIIQYALFDEIVYG